MDNDTPTVLDVIMELAKDREEDWCTACSKWVKREDYGSEGMFCVGCKQWYYSDPQVETLNYLRNLAREALGMDLL